MELSYNVHSCIPPSTLSTHSEVLCVSTCFLSVVGSIPSCLWTIFETFYLEIISNVQKVCKNKNSTKRTPVYPLHRLNYISYHRNLSIYTYIIRIYRYIHIVWDFRHAHTHMHMYVYICKTFTHVYVRVYIISSESFECRFYTSWFFTLKHFSVYFLSRGIVPYITTVQFST